jgi:hypothetical protein
MSISCGGSSTLRTGYRRKVSSPGNLAARIEHSIVEFYVFTANASFGKYVIVDRCYRRVSGSDSAVHSRAQSPA